MKKIYYVPGLISALLIPILFWYYGSQKIEELRITVMDFSIPPKLDQSNNINLGLEPLRTWNFKKIKVDPGKAKENSSLYVSEVKNLQKRNEKNTAIEFILDKKNTYGDLASLINDMAIAKHEEYALDMEKTGNFWVPVTYKDPNAEECLLCNDFIPIDAGSITTGIIHQPNIYEILNDFFLKLPKEGYYILFGFLFLINISMLSIKERFQLQ